MPAGGVDDVRRAEHFPRAAVHLAVLPPAAAATACASSDIRLDWQGDEGAASIDRFMADDESNNTYVGHRRWIVYPGESVMASGAVPGDGWTFPGTNATWVLSVVPRPADAPVSTSWPPAGFVPAPLVFNRWSFSYLNADFSTATVQVAKNGAPMSVQQEAVEYQTNADGSGTFEGDNTLVWELPGNVVNPGVDETYTVRIANVLVGRRAANIHLPRHEHQPGRAGGDADDSPGPWRTSAARRGGSC